MYSLVLMSALTTAPDATQFNGFFRDLFSFRGNSCQGTSCNGCNGCNGRSGGFGSHMKSFFSFRGESCNGGCQGGCKGSCSGDQMSKSCLGSSCQGSFENYAGSCMGTSLSCFGSSYSCIGSMPIMGNGFSSGPMIGSPPPAIGSPGISDPRAPIRPIPAPEIEESRYGRSPTLPDPKSLNRDPSRATVTVKAPADSSVYCDGQPIKLSGGERSFVTPTLPGGQTYEYTFRLEYQKDGERRSRERTVKVRAGGTTVCDFTEETTGKLPAPPAADEPKYANMIPSADPTGTTRTPGLFPIAATVPTKSASVDVKRIEATQPDRATFSVRLPADATLYVDGKKTNKTGPRREFTTPVLPVGQEFKYELKVEIPGPHGYPQSVSTTVSFKAGETVPELNFDELLKK